MGNRRGPKPQPAALQALRGGKSKGKAAEVGVEAPKVKRLPPAPAWLNSAAKKYWREYGHALKQLGVLSEADFPALAALSASAASYEIAVGRIRSVDDMITESDNGFVAVSGAQSAALQWSKEVRAWMVEFGCTPSSRRNVRPAEKPAKTAPGLAPRKRGAA